MRPRIAVIVGSTRPGRRGERIGRWVHRTAAARDDIDVEFVDVADLQLPLLDEPVPPLRGQYTQDHTRAWADTVSRFDGYVFVVGEYNHAAPAAVKNAIDYLYAEWGDKAAGFVSYGVDGGVRSVEQLRVVLAAVGIATVAATTSLRLFGGDIGPDGEPTDPHHSRSLHVVLDQVRDWSRALAPLRTAGAPSGS